jgi:hypothetical protein
MAANVFKPEPEAEENIAILKPADPTKPQSPRRELVILDEEQHAAEENKLTWLYKLSKFLEGELVVFQTPYGRLSLTVTWRTIMIAFSLTIGLAILKYGAYIWKLLGFGH